MEMYQEPPSIENPLEDHPIEDALPLESEPTTHYEPQGLQVINTKCGVS